MDYNGGKIDNASKQMKIVRVEPAPIYRDLFRIAPIGLNSTEKWNEKSMTYVGSGKAAIAIILEYLRSTNELPNKMAEIIVPSWIGNPVYHQVNWFGFPTLRPSDRSKAILVYHQYGFPQNMGRLVKFATERDLVLVEDCAHAPKSEYEGKRCGSFGRFTVYSFSKFSFCYALGGVGYTETAFEEYVNESCSKSSTVPRVLINTLKFVDDANLSRKVPLLVDQISVIRKAAFGVYGDSRAPSMRAISMWKNKRNAELRHRIRLYTEFLDQMRSLGVCSHLETKGVTPYVIPIRFDENKMSLLVNELEKIGIRTSINHFDFNRCLLEPDFRKTVLIPCHSEISDSRFAQIMGLVSDVVKGRI